MVALVALLARRAPESVDGREGIRDMLSGGYGASVSGGVRERVVHRQPLGGHDGASGARLERARLDDGAVVVVKAFDPSQDLTMRVSGRTVPLDVVLWQAGVLDRLPPTMGHAVLDAWQEDGVWVVAMRDLGDRLLGYDSVLSRRECRALLAPAVAMHDAFAGEPLDGLWSLEDRLSVFAPTVMGRYVGEASLAAWCLAGWERFADLAPADVFDVVAAVHAEPGRLAGPLLDLGGRTLLHGDYWTPNLAPTEGGVVVIDWALATAGPPVVEFASFLVGCAGQVRAGREEILDDLRELWGARTDETTLRLGLAVGAVEMGWNLAWHAARDPGAREPFDWWIAAARQAAETGLIT